MNISQVPEGLIHALSLDGNGGAKELDWDEANRWTSAQRCLWLHFNLDLAGVDD